METIKIFKYHIVCETKEELGIDIKNVVKIAYYNPYKDAVGSFCKLFTAEYNPNQKLNYNEDEVAEVLYFTSEELMKLLDESPEKFKSDYKVMLMDYLNYINKKGC